jgi:P-type Cu+ transporter
MANGQSPATANGESPATANGESPATANGASPEVADELTLAIGGMTCGACAARVERALNAVDGVTAQVNFASERASVALPAGVSLQRLIDEVASAGYTAELFDRQARDALAEDAELKRRMRSLTWRLLVSFVLFMPLCDLSILFSINPSQRPAGWQWLMVALAAPVVTWAAWPFYVAAVRGARHGAMTMDTLVSIGIVAATGWSLYSMFVLDSSASQTVLHGLAGSSGGGIYLDVPAGVTTFLLAGRCFEAWSRRRGTSALRALAAIAPREVSVLDAAGAEQRRAIAELAVGDRFVVRPGETVAADGEVLSGSSAIDRSVMTGESQPQDVAVGDAVLGGTVSVSGRLVVRACRVGADAQLGQMLRLVEQAQNEKAAVQRLADRICAVFVPVVLAIALGTLLVWLATGNPVAVALSASISVLIIACPCALGLATPAALLVATWTGARLGVFFSGYGSLEASRQIDTVVLDKTGTLTTGAMSLAGCETAASVAPDALLRAAGAVERASEHPLARAIADAAERRCDELPEVSSFLARPGIGAQGVVEGHLIEVGRFGTDPDAQATLSNGSRPLTTRAAEWERLGRTVVLVRRDGAPIGALAVADTIRPSAGPAVRRLHELGLRCVLVTGDNETAASTVGAALGIDELIAGALPSAKVEVIRDLQTAGRCVAMVGDGVNDAPALAAADLGLAVVSGADIALGAADVIVMRDDLGAVASGIGLARKTLRTIRGNLTWAFAYNVVAIPLAAAGLLDPLIAGAAMALSSSFVVWNSSRLRRAGSQMSV